MRERGGERETGGNRDRHLVRERPRERDRLWEREKDQALFYPLHCPLNYSITISPSLKVCP